MELYNWTPKTLMGKLALENPKTDLKELIKEHGSLKEPQIVDLLIPKIKVELVAVSRISHSLKSGKIYRYKVVALVGNEDGLVGCGAGKAKTRAEANKKAILEAKKNIISLESLRDSNKYTPRTTTSCKKGSTLITVTPLIGSSVTASKRGALYCGIAGLKGLKIVTGNKKRLEKGKVNCPYNYYTALHEAFMKQL